MRISATYGHGEGVVGNQGIASDTAFILHSEAHPDTLYILYDNKEKRERLIPMRDEATGKVTLHKVANSERLAITPALDADTLVRLYHWGVVGEKYFNDSTDMEIVVKENEIYPVQARPVNRPKVLPTYLDLAKLSALRESPIKETLYMETLVAGQASVVEIRNRNEMLHIDTLEKAEGAFHKGIHKLVIVNQPEPANSHPVVNFSSLGIPCLYVTDQKAIDSLLEKIDSTHSLAVCMQAATMNLWDHDRGKIENFTNEGFTVHPAKIAISLPVESKPQRTTQIAHQDVEELLFVLRNAVTPEGALETFHELKNHPWLQQLRQRKEQFAQWIATSPFSSNRVLETLRAIEALETQLQKTFEEVEAVLSRKEPVGRLEYLFHVKALETLLLASSKADGSLGQYSVSNIAATLDAADEAISYQQKLPFRAHFAELLIDGKSCPVDRIYDEWKEFLLGLEPLVQQSKVPTEDVEDFKAMMKTLRESEVLPLWLTFFFPHARSSAGFPLWNFFFPHTRTAPQKTLKALLTLFPKKEKPFVDTMLQKKRSFQSLSRNIALFADPKTFEKAWSILQQEVQSLSASQFENWDKKSPVSRSVAIETMNQLVSLFDTAIKTMKASSEFSDIEKTRIFKHTLQEFMSLLRQWAINILGENSFILHPDWDLQSYLDEIQTQLNACPNDDPEQLFPSQRFSVAAAVLGSGTAFERHLPKRLEDVFTLIHQNLLAATSTLTHRLFSLEQLKNNALPSLFKIAILEIGRIGEGHVGVPQRISIETTKESVIMRYNIPLRNHSGAFQLVYDKFTQQVTMNVQFLGAGRERWEQVQDLAEILHDIDFLRLQNKPEMSLDEVSFSWKLNSRTDIERAIREYRDMAKLSLDIDWRISEFYERVHKQGKEEHVIQFLLKTNLKSIIADKFCTAYVKDLISNGIPRDFSADSLSYVLMKSKNFPLKKSLILTFVAILKNGWTSKEVALASDHLSPNERTLISVIVEKYKQQGQQIEKLAIDLAIFGTIQRSVNFPFVWKLWETLFDQGCGIEDAIKTAKTRVIEATKPYIRYNALQLFGKLFEYGHGFEVAIETAKAGINDDDALVRNNALQLFEKIVDQGYGIDAAIEAAKAGVNDDSFLVKSYAKKLLAKLTDLGYNVE